MMDVTTLETGRTQPVYNSLDPVFPSGVQISLPAGSEAAMARHRGEAVRLKAEVFDKDLTDEDDRLGKAVFLLEGTEGTVSRGALGGCSGFGASAVSFSWRITSEITPAATLQLSEVSALNVPTGLDMRSARGSKASDPYLKFLLLEVGDLEASTRLPTKPNESSPVWSETVSLGLPRASARPPLINVRLWDDDAGDADDPIASSDVRLDGGGQVTVELPVRKGLVTNPKKVVVSFKYTIVEEPEEA